MLDEASDPSSFNTGITLAASTDIIQTKKQTQNVVAFLRGSDDILKNEYIIVGAHYDHLGMGGPGSGSRAVDTLAVHNGADDNASGVAGVLEIAEKMALGDQTNSRSIIFIAFGAEEMGLLGSKYFVNHSPVEIQNISAMFNFDMIGRFKPEEKALMIGGTGTSLSTEDILDSFADDLEFSLAYASEGFGASDHASFYAKDIPVFFITSGAHEDYHTPFDDADLLNYSGADQIAEFAYDLIFEVANRDEALVFQEAGPKQRTGGGRGFKVVLGIMPDFASQENDGLGVDAVRKDGPAFRGGMLKGDKITALNGKPVSNIYDYMTRLKELESGQTITVDVIRNGEKMVLIVQL
jgi:Zn-dependent M28 family amino/carboxypeptidase